MHPSGVGSKLTRHMLIELTKRDKKITDDLNTKTSFWGLNSQLFHTSGVSTMKSVNFATHADVRAKHTRTSSN